MISKNKNHYQNANDYCSIEEQIGEWHSQDLIRKDPYANKEKHDFLMTTANNETNIARTRIRAIENSGITVFGTYDSPESGLNSRRKCYERT